MIKKLSVSFMIGFLLGAVLNQLGNDAMEAAEKTAAAQA